MGDSKELHSAAREGRLEDLKRILSKGGVDLESTDENDETPLFSACTAGHADVVRLLLDAGMKITGRSSGDDWSGWRYEQAMNAACSRGHIDVVKVLLDKGASLNVTCDMGYVPLHAACNSEKAGVDMVRLLLEYGADPNARNEDGSTPLNLIVSSMDFRTKNYSQQFDKMNILINSGADVNLPEYHHEGGNTPLHQAVLVEHANAARILLEHGADVHALNKNCETPLQVQYYLPPPEIIMLLLEHDGGSIPCSKKKCGCGLSVMLCCYNHGLRMKSGAGFAGLFGLNFNEHVDAVEMYCSKMKAAGLMPLEDSDKGVVETYDHWRACKAELARMKMENVGNTNATFKNVWNQRPATLRQVESLPLDEIRKFPIYGMLVRRRYIMGRRKLPLMDRAQHFFSLLPPPKLPSECIDITFGFLSEDDLRNLADIVASSTKGTSKRAANELDEPLHFNKLSKTDQD